MSLKSVQQPEVACEARDDLYKGHEVKKELVVGPIVLQPPDMAYQFKDLSKSPADMSPQATTNGAACPIVSVKQEPQCYSENWMVTIPHMDVAVKEELMREDCEVNGIIVKEEPIDANLPNTPEMRSDDLPDPYFTDKLLRTRLVKIQEPKSGRGRVKHATVNKDSKKTNLNRKKQKNADKSSALEKSNSNRKKQNTVPDSDEKTILKSYKQKIYECDYCGKRFSFRPGLMNHIRTHTGEKPYSCKLCGKKFADCAVLVRHRRMHAGEKPHGCDICKRKFSEKYLLKNHKLTHTGEFQYFCQFCPKKFVNSSNFRRHQRVHMYKYICDMCNKHFETKDSLVIHIINHKKPKPFICKVCDKGFGQSGHLNRHLAIHTGRKKVYECGVCNKVFTQKESLKKHLRNRVCEKKM